MEDNSNIEIELRYLLDNPNEVEERLIKLGAEPKYKARVIDHWFLPKSITKREQHDEWFDSGKGCGIRIREQDNNNSENYSISLEAKKLTSALDHNTFQEAEIKIDSAQKANELLNLMDLKEFLTIDKERSMYKYKDFKISIDRIKNFGSGIEIEINTFLDREDALKEIQNIATELDLEASKVLEKSMTVLAMKDLAKFE